MLLSTSVVSIRIRRPRLTRACTPNCTTRLCSSFTVCGLSTRANREWILRNEPTILSTMYRLGTLTLVRR